MPNDILTTSLVAAATHNFVAYLGDAWSADLTVVDEADAAIDLSGAILKLQIKNKALDTDAVKAFTLGDGLTLSGIGNNVITVASDGTLPSRAGDYVYDLQITFPDTTVVTYLKGAFTVIQDVSR